MFYPGKDLSKDDIKVLLKQSSKLIYGVDNLNKIPALDVIECFEKNSRCKEECYKQTGVFGCFSSYSMYYPQINIKFTALPFVLKFIINKINSGWECDAERVGKLDTLSLEESFVIDIICGGISSQDKRELYLREGCGCMHVRILYKNQNDIKLSYRKNYTIESFRNREEYEKMYKFFGVRDRRKKQEMMIRLENTKPYFVYD